MAKKKTRKRYSDEDRAAALVALTANAGNIARTAAQIGVASTTLRQWARGQRHPEAAQQSEQKRPAVADRLDVLAHLLLDDLTRPEKIAVASLAQAATALGIAIDKARLLRGQPTAITANLAESLSDDDLARIASGALTQRR